MMLSTAAPMQAQMTVDPVILAFDRPDLKRQDMLVGNVGLRPLYLEVSAARILEPAAVGETYLTSPNPDEVGLLVAPRRIVLQPGEEKTVRVIRLDQDFKTDQAWRVQFKPVIGDVITDTPVAIPLIAVKALVFARPGGATAKIIGQREGRALLLANVGNTNAVISNGVQCAAPGIDCQAVSGKRLWPGMVWSTRLPLDAPVSFQVKDAGPDRSIEF
ncbi:MAG: hypothetical protein AAFY82_09760 [Pseudomonadota bacterium]